MEKNNEVEDSIELLFKQVGAFGSFQKRIIILIVFFGVISSTNIYVTIFNLAEPRLVCRDTGIDNKTIESDKVCDVWQNFTKSSDGYTCEYDNTYYGKSLTTEWNMFCNRKYMASLTQTFHLAGTVSAIFTGYFGDRFGRKRVIITSLAINVVVLASFLILQLKAIGLSVTAKYVIYCISQVLIGSFTYSLYVTSYVYFLEVTTKDLHTLFSNIILSIYVLGELFVLCLAYTIRDYEIVNLIVVGFQLLTLVIAIIFLTEGPRWLVAQKRFTEAEKIFKKIGTVNGKKIDIKISDSNNNRSSTGAVTNEESASIKDMLKHILFPLAQFRKFILLACVWFSLNLLYYGVSLGVTSIDSIDPYLMYLFASIAEFSGYMLCFLNDKFGRKRMTVVYFTLAGILCLVVAFVPRNTDFGDKKKVRMDAAIVIILASLGKCMAAAAFNTVYVFTSEYYTTNVRNFTLLFISSLGNIGAFVSPQINLAKTLWKPMPYLIFSCFALLGSVSVILLPKVKNEHSTDKEQSRL